MLKELSLALGSCWQCPYLRYDDVESDEVDSYGWFCQHPDMEGVFICSDEGFDNFHEIYPTGFHTDCPLGEHKEAEEGSPGDVGS